MLKFTGQGKDGPCYFLGLSRENISKLVDGHPIKVDLRDLGGPHVIIGILFGETERILFNELKKAGLLPPEAEFQEVDSAVAKMVRFWRKPEADDPRSPQVPA